MHNLYQSKIWQDIQTKVYQNPTSFISLFGKSHFCIHKEKNIWPFSISWLQIMWIYIPDDEESILQEIKTIRKRYRFDPSKICMQRWCLNHLVTIKTPHTITQAHAQAIKTTRKEAQFWLKKLWLHETIRENMPPATIIINVQQSNDELIADMSSQAQRYIKKASKKDITIHELHTMHDCDFFYSQRQNIADTKWFNIIPSGTFKRLVEYIQMKHCGHIYVAKKDNVIIAGGIYIYQEDTVYYLYGFSTREKELRNIWWHHFLTFHVMQRAR